MNKPNINDEKYKFPHCENEIETYLEFIDDLKEYCDELEEKLKDNEVAWNDLRNDYLLLEKALDTACEALGDNDYDGCWYCPFGNGNHGHKLEGECIASDGYKCTKEDWKNWLLKVK